MYSDDYENDDEPIEQDDLDEREKFNPSCGIAAEIIVHVSTAESKLCPICKKVPARRWPIRGFM
jgi:hypothetical protein